ncbi:peptidylprolyl isomerase [Candidatus Woesearchaeota archaeon]|nr:peptidylprolyl isomerase [Candidatus Woesearchaeota archaeon]
MAETVQKGDFVELDYTGAIKDGDIIFDTTIEEVAKKEGLFDDKMTYSPVAICVGQGQILSGLDSSIEGLEIGTEQDVLLPPEKAFGKKDGKLMKLVPMSAFKKQGINPVPGLQIQIDGAMGVIRTASGGRCVVDFNSPLAGKEIIYKVKLIRKITDDKEKVLALVVLALNQKKESLKVDIAGKKATITVQKEVPEELLKLVKERIVQVMDNIDEVEFKTPSAPSKKPTSGSDTVQPPAEKTIDKDSPAKADIVGEKKEEPAEKKDAPKPEGQQTLQQ